MVDSKENYKFGLGVKELRYVDPSRHTGKKTYTIVKKKINK